MARVSSWLSEKRMRSAPRSYRALSRGHCCVALPGVVDIEGARHERRLVPLGEHEEAGFERVQLGARLFPEIGGHHAGRVAAETVEIELTHPVLQHVDHVAAKLRIAVVERRHV